MDEVDTGTSSTGTSAKTALSDQILAALKEKPAPELCLDSQDLEVGENDVTIFRQIPPSGERLEGKLPLLQEALMSMCFGVTAVKFNLFLLLSTSTPCLELLCNSQLTQFQGL